MNNKDLKSFYLAKYIKTYIILNITVKRLNFVGSSLDDIRNFPDEARRAAGFELRAVQNGLEPSNWKPMHKVGPGVNEIRIRVLGEWRIIYVAKFRDAVYVLHAFQKKAQKTSRPDIDLARQRYGQIGGNL
jgi:phage-related protein